jgi:uncharacterized protein YcfL
MKKWFIIWALMGILFGCASTQEVDNNQNNEFSNPEQTRQNIQQMQRSIMDSRQRRMRMGR